MLETDDFFQKMETLYQEMQARQQPFTKFYKDPTIWQSTINNPYWEIIKSLPGEEWFGHWQPKTYIIKPGASEDKRNPLCIEYAWAIPDPITLQFVVDHANGRLVEMGAGTGYWSWMLSQLGVDVLAYDLYPPHLSTNNHYHTPREIKASQSGEYIYLSDQITGTYGKTYFPVEQGTPEVLAQHSDRTLFLCWPPYSDSMAAECLKHYQGTRLIYIGEGDGGCTGDDEFHKMLEESWEQVDEHRLIQWEHIHDWVTVYDRE